MKKPVLDTWKLSANEFGLGFSTGGGGDDDGIPDNRFFLSLFKRRWNIRLPTRVKPYGEFVKWSDPSCVGRHGTEGYTNWFSRQWSICTYDTSVMVYFGPQTHSSTTTKCSVLDIPWLATKFRGYKLYDTDNKTQLADIPERPNRRVSYEEYDNARVTIPRVKFLLTDQSNDNRPVTVTCFVEERRWSRGSSWCSWLKYITPDLVRRDVDLAFDLETGPRVGSWKGGTVGASIDTRPGEPIVDAVLRYCHLNNLTLHSQV